jgi:N-acetylneuraminic acid mutarotase
MNNAWRKLDFTLHQNVALERAGHAAVAVGKTIYVVGGRRGRTFFGDVLKFDATAGFWEVDCDSSSSDFIPRAGHSATLIGRSIWVVGGSNNEAIFNDICCYDVDLRSWTYPKFK